MVRPALSDAGTRCLRGPYLSQGNRIPASCRATVSTRLTAREVSSIPLHISWSPASMARANASNSAAHRGRLPLREKCSSLPSLRWRVRGAAEIGGGLLEQIAPGALDHIPGRGRTILGGDAHRLEGAVIHGQNAAGINSPLDVGGIVHLLGLSKQPHDVTDVIDGQVIRAPPACWGSKTGAVWPAQKASYRLNTGLKLHCTSLTCPTRGRSCRSLR